MTIKGMGRVTPVKKQTKRDALLIIDTTKVMGNKKLKILIFLV